MNLKNNIIGLMAVTVISLSGCLPVTEDEPQGETDISSSSVDVSDDSLVPLTPAQLFVQTIRGNWSFTRFDENTNFEVTEIIGISESQVGYLGLECNDAECTSTNKALGDEFTYQMGDTYDLGLRWTAYEMIISKNAGPDVFIVALQNDVTNPKLIMARETELALFNGDILSLTFESDGALLSSFEFHLDYKIPVNPSKVSSLTGTWETINEHAGSTGPGGAVAPVSPVAQGETVIFGEDNILTTIDFTCPSMECLDRTYEEDIFSFEVTHYSATEITNSFGSFIKLDTWMELPVLGFGFEKFTNYISLNSDLGKLTSVDSETFEKLEYYNEYSFVE